MVEPDQSYGDARHYFQTVTRVNRLEDMLRKPTPDLNTFADPETATHYWAAIQFTVATMALERRDLHARNLQLGCQTMKNLGFLAEDVTCDRSSPPPKVSVDEFMRAALDREYVSCRDQPKFKLKNVNGCGNLSFSVLARMYHLSTQKPVGSPYRLSPATELRLRQYFLLVLNWAIDDREYSPAANAGEAFKEHGTSENHITTGQGMAYFAAYHLQRSQDHGNKVLKNGLTVREAYNRYRNHWVLKTREYIKRGLLVETNSHKYWKYTVSMLVTLADIAPDAPVRNGVRDLMDLIFLQSALETLPNGVRAGAQSRKSPGETANAAAQLYLLYTNDDIPSVRNEAVAGGFFGDMNEVYFPAEAVWKIWRHATRTNSYEVQSRVPGVLFNVENDDLNLTESSYRNTYVTPNFSLGSYLLELNRLFYATATAESRGMALHVNEEASTGNFDDVGQVLFGPGKGACFDKVVGLQKKGALIFQNSIEFHLRGHRSDPEKMWGPIDCFGRGGAKTGARNIASYRILPNGTRLNLLFEDAETAIRADAHVDGPGQGEGNDVTRNYNDIEISHAFRISTPDNSRRDIYLASPGGTTFAWIKAVASDLEIGGDEPKYSRVKLSTDKFSPVVALAAPAANFDGDLEKFKREKMLDGKLVYAKNRVTFQPSLRATLEPGDVFVDSSRATPLEGGRAAWETSTTVAAHDRHSLKSLGYDSAVTFPVTVEKDGVYYLKIRASGIKSAGVRIGDQPWSVADVNDGLAGMKWVDLNVFEEGQAGVRVNRVRLAAGTHKITFVFRKSGVEVDALALQLARNEPPAELEFQELIDRKQAPSLVNGKPAVNSFKYGAYTFFSPFARSVKDSGRWEIRYGSSRLLIDHSVLPRVRNETTDYSWE